MFKKLKVLPNKRIIFRAVPFLAGFWLVGNFSQAKKFSWTENVPLSPVYEEFFEQIRPYLGSCVIEKFHKRYPRFDAFDRTVLRYWENIFFNSQFDGSERLKNILVSANVDPSQLVAIDALARTLYAEMDRGFDHGVHYGRAIAGVVLNRAEAIDTKKRGYQAFSLGQQKQTHPLKNTITKVVIAKRQFSAWDGVIKGRSNPVLSHALCPPTEPQTPFWKSFSPQYKYQPMRKKLPSSVEIQHWNLAVRIAIESTLEPERFWSNFLKYNRRTGTMMGQRAFPIYFYTSGFYKKGEQRGKRVTLFAHRRDGGFQVVKGPSIAGRADFKERLLRFWAPRTVR